MNYAQSRQREKTRLWDWTVMNNEKIHRSDPCSDKCQHKTREDADRHFYDWSLSQVEEIEYHLADHCEVCGKWTNKTLGNIGFWKLQFGSWLCDEHRNKEELIKFHPFYSPIEMIYS